METISSVVPYYRNMLFQRGENEWHKPVYKINSYELARSKEESILVASETSVKV